MQSDLNSVYSWADENSMALNSSKFELLQYGKIKVDGIYSYVDSNGNGIVSTENVKDLGIHMSSNSNFSFHINTVISKANNLTSWAL